MMALLRFTAFVQKPCTVGGGLLRWRSGCQMYLCG